MSTLRELLAAQKATLASLPLAKGSSQPHLPPSSAIVAAAPTTVTTPTAAAASSSSSAASPLHAVLSAWEGTWLMESPLPQPLTGTVPSSPPLCLVHISISPGDPASRSNPTDRKGGLVTRSPLQAAPHGARKCTLRWTDDGGQRFVCRGELNDSCLLMEGASVYRVVSTVPNRRPRPPAVSIASFSATSLPTVGGAHGEEPKHEPQQDATFATQLPHAPSQLVQGKVVEGEESRSSTLLASALVADVVSVAVEPPNTTAPAPAAALARSSVASVVGVLPRRPTPPPPAVVQIVDYEEIETIGCDRIPRVVATQRPAHLCSSSSNPAYKTFLPAGPAAAIAPAPPPPRSLVTGLSEVEEFLFPLTIELCRIPLKAAEQVRSEPLQQLAACNSTSSSAIVGTGGGLQQSNSHLLQVSLPSSSGVPQSCSSTPRTLYFESMEHFSASSLNLQSSARRMKHNAEGKVGTEPPPLEKHHQEKNHGDDKEDAAKIAAKVWSVDRSSVPLHDQQYLPVMEQQLEQQLLLLLQQEQQQQPQQQQRPLVYLRLACDWKRMFHGVRGTRQSCAFPANRCLSPMFAPALIALSVATPSSTAAAATGTAFTPPSLPRRNVPSTIVETVRRAVSASCWYSIPWSLLTKQTTTTDATTTSVISSPTPLLDEGDDALLLSSSSSLLHSTTVCRLAKTKHHKMASIATLPIVMSAVVTRTQQNQRSVEGGDDHADDGWSSSYRCLFEEAVAIATREEGDDVAHDDATKKSTAGTRTRLPPPSRPSAQSFWGKLVGATLDGNVEAVERLLITPSHFEEGREGGEASNNLSSTAMLSSSSLSSLPSHGTDWLGRALQALFLEPNHPHHPGESPMTILETARTRSNDKNNHERRFWESHSTTTNNKATSVDDTHSSGSNGGDVLLGREGASSSAAHFASVLYRAEDVDWVPMNVFSCELQQQLYSCSWCYTVPLLLSSSSPSSFSSSSSRPIITEQYELVVFAAVPLSVLQDQLIPKSFPSLPLSSNPAEHFPTTTTNNNDNPHHSVPNAKSHPLVATTTTTTTAAASPNSSLPQRPLPPASGPTPPTTTAPLRFILPVDSTHRMLSSLMRSGGAKTVALAEMEVAAKLIPNQASQRSKSSSAPTVTSHDDETKKAPTTRSGGTSRHTPTPPSLPSFGSPTAAGAGGPAGAAAWNAQQPQQQRRPSSNNNNNSSAPSPTTPVTLPPPTVTSTTTTTTSSSATRAATADDAVVFHVVATSSSSEHVGTSCASPSLFPQVVSQQRFSSLPMAALSLARGLRDHRLPLAPS